ncbi:MAG: HEAT repeat domain-containing protein, partial [Candidatus Hydrogenedentes bacterium]|nr:HEAT repeat domain-containing protein [Candidatus Hydrogenedentota bacterium]
IADLYRETIPDSGNNDVYVDALVTIDGDFAEQTFMEILKGNPSENKRWQAAHALGKLKGTQAVPLLRDAILFDTNDEVKKAAIEALGHVGEEAARALATLQDVQDWRTRNLYLEYADDIAMAFSAMDNQISSDPLARLYQDCEKEPYLLPARLTAAATLAKRADPRGKTMLQELQNIPETRIAATNALQELAQQSEPEADTATPADAGDQTDQTDQWDQSDQSTAEAQPATQLPGPRLQFRWVVEGEDAVGKTVLPAPTEDEPDRTLVVGDDVVFYEGDVASAITKKEPNRDAYAVFFVTTEDGEKRLWNATEQNQGKRLAIIFDGRVLSSPVVQSPIGKSGQITGDLTEEEAEVIARAINDALGDDGGESMPKPTLYDEEVVLPDGREPILDRDAAEKRGYKIEEAPGGDEPFLYDKLLRREGEVMSQDLLKPVVPEVVEPR